MKYYKITTNGQIKYEGRNYEINNEDFEEITKEEFDKHVIDEEIEDDSQTQEEYEEIMGEVNNEESME